MDDTIADLSPSIPCPCGKWWFRHGSVGSGLSAAVRWCPRCKSLRLLVVRGHHVVGAPLLEGQDEPSLRRALLDVEVEPKEVELLVGAFHRQAVG